MSARTLLRIASVLALIQFFAHTLALVSYKPKHGPEEAAIISAMKSRAFDFRGFRLHSYWDLYFGYGLFAAVNCAIESVLFWQVSATPGNVKNIIALFCLANIVYGILVWKYFFIVPLILDLAIALCLAYSWSIS